MDSERLIWTEMSLEGSQKAITCNHWAASIRSVSVNALPSFIWHKTTVKKIVFCVKMIKVFFFLDAWKSSGDLSIKFQFILGGKTKEKK